MNMLGSSWNENIYYVLNNYYKEMHTVKNHVLLLVNTVWRGKRLLVKGFVAFLYLDNKLVVKCVQSKYLWNLYTQ